MVPPLFTSFLTERGLSRSSRSQTLCAITGAPDIPYFSRRVGRFRQLLREVTSSTALSPLHQTEALCPADTSLTSSLHHSNKCSILLDSTPFPFLCQWLCLYSSASFSSSSAPSKMAGEICTPPVRRANSSLRPARSSSVTRVYVLPAFSAFRTE